jgi:hypothetical protein
MLIREWVGFIIATTILGLVAQTKALSKVVALVEFEHWFASRRHKPTKLGLVALRENCSKIMRRKDFRYGYFFMIKFNIYWY